MDSVIRQDGTPTRQALTRRRFLWGAAAGVGLAAGASLLGACQSAPAASGGQPSSGQAPSNPQGTSLQLWLSGPGYDAFLKDLVPAFQKDNPQIKLDATTMDWTVYQQKIQTAVAGGTPPDVFSFYSTDVAPWGSQGILADLQGVVDRSAFTKEALESGTWSDKLYALPLGMKVRPLFYRTDWLSEAGFNAAPKSWDDLRGAAQKLVHSDSAGNLDRVGFWIPTSHPYKTNQMWLAFLWGNGGEPFDASGKKVTFNGPEGVAATQFLGDLLNQSKVDKPGAIKVDNTDFFQGKVAMLVSNIVNRGMDKDAPQLVDKTGVAVPPYNKAPAIELSGEMLGMAQGTKNRDAAATLVKYLATNNDAVLKYNRVDSNIPGLQSAQSSDYMKNDVWMKRFQPLLQYGRPLPKHPKWNETAALVTTALDEVYLKNRPAKDALDDAARKVEDLLK